MKGYVTTKKGLLEGTIGGICYIPLQKRLFQGIQERICSLSIKDYFGEFKREYVPHQKGLFQRDMFLLQKGLFQGEKRGYDPSPKRAIPLLPETPL
jgi:hypothetical protein